MIEGLESFYRFGPAPPDRPWVIMSMISSVDGATALDGRSGGLGHPTDQAILGLVRQAADVIVVGAATVRAEQYRPVREPKELVIISHSGDLGSAAAVAEAPNTTVVTSAPGAAEVDLAAVLASHAGRVVVSEGGPSLNGQLLAAGLIDEVCVTVSPRLIAGPSARLAHGPDQADAQPWDLRHVLHEDGLLFLRYRCRRSSSANVRSAGTAN